MGLFSWLFGSDGTSSRINLRVADVTNCPGNFEVEVVGESHYQAALKSICGGYDENGHRLEVKACLVPENDNPHDSKAIRIYIQDKTVGYLDRETARSFRKKMAEIGLTDVAVKCDALIVGGWDRGGGDRGYFGVKLDLPRA